MGPTFYITTDEDDEPVPSYATDWFYLAEEILDLEDEGYVVIKVEVAHE